MKMRKSQDQSYKELLPLQEHRLVKMTWIYLMPPSSKPSGQPFLQGPAVNFVGLWTIWSLFQLFNYAITIIKVAINNI